MLLLPPKAAANGRPGRPKRGATPPEGEGNPAEGGYFASLHMIMFITYILKLKDVIEHILRLVKTKVMHENPYRSCVFPLEIPISLFLSLHQTFSLARDFIQL